MKETAADKIVPGSPAPVGTMWGDTSPSVIGDQSPTGSILHKPSTPPHNRDTQQDESKGIAEGFLSEVSTPEVASRNGQEVPSAENERDYQNVSTLSPSKLLPATDNELKVKDESKPGAIPFPVSEVEEICQHPVRFPDKTTSGRNLNEQTENNSSAKSYLQQESEQNAKTMLKRKGPSGNEGRVERKRVKSGRSDRSQGKGSGQGSHLSEEELKKLRRVKNRESVEKCRTKQRLRMEALQVEQTCLRLENKNLRDAMALIHAAQNDITMEVTKIKNQMENNSEEEKSEKMKEMRKEVRA